MRVEPATALRPRRLLQPDEFRRTLWRLASELRERHPEGDPLLCGILTRGAFLAQRLLGLTVEQGHRGWEAASLDVGPYRDDAPRLRPQGSLPPPLPFATKEAVADRDVILVDDVLFHGRTARAALAAVAELGRPRAVELLVMVDRGHRELPLRATYVGRNLPTSEAERVLVQLQECDGHDQVLLRPDREARP
ncbi:MAG: bifunctional pyr operon transcriptional regulator/uracil phosphoribosyltransferase PyrR [Candidatus Dormibacteria bacterium]